MAIIRTLTDEDIKRKRDELEQAHKGNGAGNPDPLHWMEGLELSSNDLESIEEAEWVYENLLITGHMVALIGEPGAGKTTIMLHVAAHAASNGYRVVYVNADTSPAEAKRMHQMAQAGDFRLLVPDLKVGQSMESVVGYLSEMATYPGELSDVVFIFDTLKKMTDVIAKSKARMLYKLFRKLTGSGVTIVCNGHTNKYKGDDGKPIFEGTIDLRSDFDELIYLIPDKQSDGSLLVSTAPDKVRGIFEPITFRIGNDRTVERVDYVDVLDERRKRVLLTEDADIIARVEDCLRGGVKTQVEIIDALRPQGISRRQTRRVLGLYATGEVCQKWGTSVGMRNSRQYWLCAEKVRTP